MFPRELTVWPGVAGTVNCTNKRNLQAKILAVVDSFFNGLDLEIVATRLSSVTTAPHCNHLSVDFSSLSLLVSLRRSFTGILFSGALLSSAIYHGPLNAKRSYKSRGGTTDRYELYGHCQCQASNPGAERGTTHKDPRNSSIIGLQYRV